MRIDLNSKYSLASDSRQFMIIEKNKIKDKNSKNYGQIIEKTIGYFHNPSSALTFLLDRGIKENTTVNEVEKLFKELEIAKKEILNKYKDFDRVAREERDKIYEKNNRGTGDKSDDEESESEE